jgi:UDP-N-acetylglucosamine:LPS N-acetylglucosamine transferase
VDDFADVVSSLLTNENKRLAICHALAEWGERDAATEIAKKMIEVALPQENLNMDWSTEPVV